MGAVVLAGVDAPLVSSLRNNAALSQAYFEEVADAERALARLGEGEVDAVVIGAGVPEAMVLAQRAHAKDRDVAVLLLAAQGTSAEIAAALRYAPYLGPEVSWCERTPDEVQEMALAAKGIAVGGEVSRARSSAEKKCVRAQPTGQSLAARSEYGYGAGL